MSGRNDRSEVAIIAVVLILAGLILVAMSIPMFMAAWEEYQLACPSGTTKVSCQ